MACSAAQGFRPDYLYLLQRLCMDNPEGAVNLAKTVAKQPGPPIDLNTMADMFLQRNMVREATAFLLEVLQDNDPQHDKLQTKVSKPSTPVHAHLDTSHGCFTGFPIRWCQVRQGRRILQVEHGFAFIPSAAYQTSIYC